MDAAHSAGPRQERQSKKRRTVARGVGASAWAGQRRGWRRIPPGTRLLGHRPLGWRRRAAAAAAARRRSFAAPAVSIDRRRKKRRIFTPHTSSIGPLTPERRKIQITNGTHQQLKQCILSSPHRTHHCPLQLGLAGAGGGAALAGGDLVPEPNRRSCWCVLGRVEGASCVRASVLFLVVSHTHPRSPQQPPSTGGKIECNIYLVSVCSMAS